MLAREPSARQTVYSIVVNDPFGRNTPVARDAILLSSPLLHTKTMDWNIIGTSFLMVFV
jgi:hypothetical protein